MRQRRAVHFLVVLLVQMALGLIVPAHHHGARAQAGQVSAQTCPDQHHDHPAPASSHKEGCVICMLAQGLSTPPQYSAELQKLDLLDLQAWPEPFILEASAPTLPFFGRAPPTLA